MTPKQFVGLAVAAAVSVTVAIVSYSTRNTWAPGTASGAALMPSVAARANDIAAVQVVQGDKALTVERGSDAWRIKERDGYPAQVDKVRTLVVQLAQATLAERKTQSPQKHAALELEDPKAKDAKSRLVRLLDGAGKVIGEVVVGKSRFEAFGSGKPGVYVRQPNDAQTWLAIGPIDAPLDARDWVSRTVLDLGAAQVAALSWNAPGTPEKESLKVKRKSDTEPALEIEVPAGKKAKASESADGIARAFARIDLDDVRKAVAPDKDTRVGKATLTTSDKLTVDFSLAKQGETSWLSIVARGEGDAKAKADAINAKTQGWQFKISPGTAGQMFKTAAELFETS